MELVNESRSCGCESTAERHATNILKAICTVAGIVILFLFLGGIVLVYNLRCSTSAAEFGDSFGVVNAFFSALAFGVIAVGLYVQMGELRHSLEAFEDTAQAQRDSASVQRTATFVQALDLQKQLLDHRPFRADQLWINQIERMKLFTLFDHMRMLDGLTNELSADTGTPPCLESKTRASEEASRRKSTAEQTFSTADRIYSRFINLEPPKSEEEKRARWNEMQSFDESTRKMLETTVESPQHLKSLLEKLEATADERRKGIEVNGSTDPFYQNNPYNRMASIVRKYAQLALALNIEAAKQLGFNCIPPLKSNGKDEHNIWE